MATFENSSHIKEATWDGGVLTVQFKGGERYEFYDVPNGIFQELQAAPSAGRYFLNSIRGKFDSAKV